MNSEFNPYNYIDKNSGNKSSTLSNISENDFRGEKPKDFDYKSKSYEKLFGSYVEKTLVPQVGRKAAHLMSSLEKTVGIIDGVKNKEEIENLYKRIKTRSNLRRISYLLEYKLSTEGAATVVFDYVNNETVNLYVPTINITRVNPADGELDYLQIVRFFKGGTFINILTEVRTRTKTIWQYFQVDNSNEAFADMTSGNNLDTYTNSKNSKKWEDIEKDMEGKGFDVDEPKDEENTHGFIFAQYFENLPSENLDFRGQTDFDPRNSYTPILNKLNVRWHWELDFNKSKFFVSNETGTNVFGNKNTNYSQMVEENFVYKNNDFMRPIGDGQAGFEYFETSNANLLNLQALMLFYKKLWWEHTGFHMSKSDTQGKNITEYEAKLEREAEWLRFEMKKGLRQDDWKILLWKIARVSLGKVATKNLTSSDIIFDNPVYRIRNEKEVLENSIMKIQAGLSTHAEEIKVIAGNLSIEEAEEMAQKYLEVNAAYKKQDILTSKPVQTQDPSPANPEGDNTNNQAKSYYDQLDKDKVGK